MKRVAVMDKEQQAEQHEIAEHLKTWAYWYARANKIIKGALTFPDELAEEAAGLEAYDKWDEAFCWLEAHGITDEDIVYDEGTESATLKPKSPPTK